MQINDTRGKRRKGELSPMQQVFVDHYLQGRSARSAAKAAGYTDPTSVAWKIMQSENVVAAIDKGKEEMRRRNHHVEDELVSELALVAFCDLTDVVSISGNSFIVKNLDEIPEGIRKCIRKVKVTPGKFGDTVTVELHDKLKAAELLGKYLDLWSERVKVEGGDKPVQVEHTVSKMLVEDRIRMLKGEETYDDL